MYLERRCMYMYFEKVNFVFLYLLCSIWTLLEHLNIISRTKELAYACTVSACAHNAHKRCTSPQPPPPTPHPRFGEPEVTGSIPDRDIQKFLKMVLAASPISLRLTRNTYPINSPMSLRLRCAKKRAKSCRRPYYLFCQQRQQLLRRMQNRIISPLVQYILF